jgi:hypothetical protein
MKPGVIAFILIIILYSGFEVYAVHRTGYRMEPEFIYTQHIRAAHAVDVCGIDKSAGQARFDRNFAYAQQRARDALLADENGEPAGGVNAAMTALAAAARDDVDALIAEKGCDDIEAWKLSRRFDLLARANPPIRD